jgi:hypothetical protein
VSLSAPVAPSTTRPALRGIESTFAAGVTHPAVGAALQRFDVRLDDVALVNLVTRSAPMGAVTAELVHATFYNANPDFITSIIPAIWDVAPPDALLAVQADAFAPVLGAAVSAMDAGELAELAELARTAGEAARAHRYGRALLAGLSGRPWPGPDHLDIWHAAKLLREHRGDGHVALLVAAGLSGVDALVVHAAYDGIPPDALRLSRRWNEDVWAASVEDLRVRGWLTDDALPTLTAEGRTWRKGIEDRTDELAAMAFAPLGQAGVDRMTELGQILTRVLGDADVIPAHYRIAARKAD